MIRRNLYVEISIIILIVAGFTYITLHSKTSPTEEELSGKLGITVNENTEFIWNLGSKTNIAALKLSGTASETGTAKAYIENNNRKYLIIDNSLLKNTGSQEINFQKTCVDTCSLRGFEKSSYKLMFEVTGGAVLNVNEVYYTRHIPGARLAPNEISLIIVTTIVLVLLFAALIWYEKDRIKALTGAIFRVREGDIKKFHTYAKKADFISRKDKEKAVEAYKELNKLYSRFVKSDIDQKDKKNAYKVMQKLYQKIKTE